MPLSLYDLPNWLFGIVICGGWVVIGLTGYVVFHRICRVTFAEGEKNLAIALLAVIATVNSLLLAFSAVSVWDSYDSADHSVRGEANTIGMLGRDLAVFDSVESNQARELLKAYAKSVLEVEWASMRAIQPSRATWAAVDDMFRAVGNIKPASPREQALMPEIWARTNEIIKYRRERLYASEAQVPVTLWAAVAIGMLLTISAMYVFPCTAFNLTAVATLSCSLGLVFFFIAAMDRPFAGTESISPEPIATALSNMKRWDEETRKAPKARRPWQCTAAVDRMTR
jgi:hypothetical protein